MSSAEKPSTLQRFFFLDPTFGTLLMVMCLLAGLVGVSALVKEDLPDLKIPMALVTTEWVGADASSIDKNITDELETEITTIWTLKAMRSASFDSFSIISVEFDADADIDESMAQLRAKIDTAEANLPPEAESPEIEQISVDNMPVLSISLYGDLDPALLARTADALQSLLEKVDGVNEVDILGEREEVVQVQLIRPRLHALGLSSNAVSQALKDGNVDQPLAAIEMDSFTASTRLNGRFRTLDDIRELPVVRLDGGRVVRLSEVAHVRRDLERAESTAQLSVAGGEYKPVLEISITRLPGADTLATIDGAKAVLQSFTAGDAWPLGLDYHVTADQSLTINENLRSVFDNGWQAVVAVFIVLLLVLTWREATMAGLCIPITFGAALGVVWMLGYTLNQMVIIGMVLALGLLVDVFILMMEGLNEGIHERKESFDDAALATIRTYAMPAFAGQLTTILAMAPLMAIAGTEGKFIRLIPVTAVVCLVLSYLIGIFVAVPVSRYLLQNAKPVHKQPVLSRICLGIARWLHDYSLRVPLRNKLVSFGFVLAAFAALIGSGWLMSKLPAELYPPSDEQDIGVTIELPAETSLERSQQCADAAGQLLRGYDVIQTAVKFTGERSPMATTTLITNLMQRKSDNLIGFSVKLKHLDEREQRSYEFVEVLRTDLTALLEDWPGSSLILSPKTSGSNGDAPIVIDVFGSDAQRLNGISLEIQELLRATHGVEDVRDIVGQQQTEIRLLPRRESLSFYDIELDDVASQMRFALSDPKVSDYDMGALEDDLEIRLGTEWPGNHGLSGGPSNFAELQQSGISLKDGRQLPVAALMVPQADLVSQSLVRSDGSRCVSVLAANRGRTFGEVMADVRPQLDAMQAGWPDGYSYRLGGEASSSSETFSSAATMLYVSIFMVFAVLVLQFRSYLQPFVIMLSIPMALIGTMLGFFLIGMSFSFPAMIGVIALVGIAVNDAIVMIDTMNRHRENGLTVREAAARGAADRLRPIIATTITTLVGLVPLALSDPMWTPLCAAIIFGLIASTVIAVLIVPCLYFLLTRQPAEAEA